MKSLKQTGLLGLLVLIPFVVSAAPVWVVENQGRSLYLAGTIHLLAAEDYPLPLPFETAYQQSDSVVFESDVSQMQSAEFQQRIITELSYPPDQNLTQFVEADTLQELVIYLRERNLPVVQMMRFRPGLIAIIMTIEELKRLEVTAAGVDEHFAKRARDDGKMPAHLETADQQLSFLASIGEGRENEMLSYHLQEINDMPVMWDQLMSAWRSGDMEALTLTGINPLKAEFPNVYDMLIRQRNQNWMPQIEAMVESPATELVLVGSLHLAGEDGLLAQLSSRGFEVKQLQ